MDKPKLEERHLDLAVEEGPGGSPEIALVVECPACGTKTRHRTRGVTGAVDLACDGCSAVFPFSGDDLQEHQRMADEQLESLMKSGAASIRWTSAE